MSVSEAATARRTGPGGRRAAGAHHPRPRPARSRRTSRCAGSFARGRMRQCWSSRRVRTLGDKAALLDAGADDYLTKPFDPVELAGACTRTAASLRRRWRAHRRIEAGDLVIDLVQRSVTLARRSRSPDADRVGTARRAVDASGAHPDAPAAVQRGLAGSVRTATRRRTSAFTSRTCGESSSRIRCVRVTS